MRTGSLVAILLLGASTGACLSTPSQGDAPGPGTIAGIESGRTLLRMMESVGVPHGDPGPMNRAARTRVRSVRCTAIEPGRATCSYEADHCLAEEKDDDHDGWCARSTTFVRDAPQQVLMETRIDGWTTEQP